MVLKIFGPTAPLKWYKVGLCVIESHTFFMVIILNYHNIQYFCLPLKHSLLLVSWIPYALGFPPIPLPPTPTFPFQSSFLTHLFNIQVVRVSFFEYIIIIILVVPGVCCSMQALHCCMWAISSCGEEGLLSS